MLDQHLHAFLKLVAWSEGTSSSPVTQHDGYDVVVSGTGGAEVFTDFRVHPFEVRAPQLVRAAHGTVPALYSTAAGRYQVLLRYWRIYRERLGLQDFAPASQDAVATQQLRECGTTAALGAGNIAAAIQRASGIWASLPGNSYGQGGHSLPVLLQQWDRCVAAV